MAPERGHMQVVVAGGTPLALLAALFLRRAGKDVLLIDPGFDAPAPFCNPDMGLIGGDDTLSALTLQALQAWSAELDVLGDDSLSLTPWLDIAIGEPMAERLKDEATLDMLAGYEVVFKTAYEGFSAKVSGMKVWKDAPLLPLNLVDILRKAVRTVGIEVTTAGIETVDMTLPETPVVHLTDGRQVEAHPLILVCPVMAAGVLGSLGLRLPLRPACSHLVTLHPTAPVAEQVVLSRLKRGHLWLFPTGNGDVTLFYDAINDPAQARYGVQVQSDVLHPLLRHVSGMCPALQDARIVAVRGQSVWMTPDFLPVYGPWPAMPGLVLATGWGGREPLFAPLVAQWLVQAVTVPDAAPLALADVLAPNRFSAGFWQRVDGPGTLLAVWGRMAMRRDGDKQLEYMETVRTVDAQAAVQRAAEVVQKEKQTQRAPKVASIAQEPRVRGKPKIQTAAIKKYE